MAGSYAREGDQTTGHGSYPPAVFETGSSLCQKAQIEGKPMLTVDVFCGPHQSPSGGSPTLGGAPFNPLGGKIIQGSPTCKVKCDDGVFRQVARIGDSLDCGCKIVGGAKTVGGGAGG
jgi:uncharacterized Zn-binding protein involved in type VI secretion